MAAAIGRGCALCLLLLFLGTGAAPALAHAERTSSTPESRSRVAAPPTEVSVSFTEPPVADADFQVLDGCQRDVVDELDVQGTDITASLSEGQPGRWRVEFHVVSGIDGHPTRDAFSFRVRGAANCTQEEDPPPAAGEHDAGDDDGGGGLLIALFAGGTVVVVALALVLRGRGSG